MKEGKRIIDFSNANDNVITLRQYYENGGDPESEVVILTRHAQYREGKLKDWIQRNGISEAGRYTVNCFYEKFSQETFKGVADSNDEGPWVTAANVATW